ncbi:smoothened, frizzled class receptor [Tachypleus tridentatus]|uniref:smoothened, frizzled class receptor n=1 Tax=Tachypleus tridentatus TaxID=6853 RepID=UPI003FD2090F
MWLHVRENYFIGGIMISCLLLIVMTPQVANKYEIQIGKNSKDSIWKFMDIIPKNRINTGNRIKREYKNIAVHQVEEYFKEEHQSEGILNSSYSARRFDLENNEFQKRIKGQKSNIGNLNIPVSSVEVQTPKMIDVHKTKFDHVQPGGKESCYKPAHCQPLYNTTCFGVKLPYAHTALALVNTSESLADVKEQLILWKGLQSVPRCWAVIQPLLCAVYLPKCENGQITLPSQEMCKVTRGPCQVVQHEFGWPEFLKCNSLDRFPPACKNEVRELKFSVNSHCQRPLVDTVDSDIWHKDVHGCGIQCQNPLFSSEEHNQVHSFIAVVGTVCLLCTMFTIITFIVDWKSASKYPALIIFYINACFFIVTIGWMAQFTPGARDDIVCRQDGTLRQGEPRSGENLSCIIIFILIYYFLMAGIIWFVFLTYAWHVSFQAVGIPREVIESRAAYFHIVAWSVPLVLTIAIMALGQVDGDSLMGICFVGYLHPSRAGFVLAPVSVAVFCGGFFLIKSLIALVKVKLGSAEVVSEEANIRIRHMIIRMGTFTLLVFLLAFCTFGCHVYEFLNQANWIASMEDFVICAANITLAGRSNGETLKGCKAKSHPNIMTLQLHVLAMFGTGVLMSSWVWTSATKASWKRFFNRVFHQSEEEPVRMRRHKLIAQAFAQQQGLHQAQSSFSFHSTHDDPVGMNLELNSIASEELSSTWAAALPKFISRRGALVGAGSMGIRGYSSTSDISQRRVSLDSFDRQQSFDSQMSFQVSEQEWVAHALARHQRRKTRRERERLWRGHNRILPWSRGNRRGSDTSSQSAAVATQPNALNKTTITQATSTGDLNQAFFFHRPPTAFVISRPMIQKHNLINPPFTHGMTDNSHRQQKSNDMTDNPHQQQKSNSHPAPIGNLGTMPGILNQSGFMSNVGLFGYMGTSIPGQVGLPMGVGYTPLPGSVGYQHYNSMPFRVGYSPFQSMAATLPPGHSPILPMHPMIDSSSEQEFFPIRISDTSDYEAGLMSQDEAQILSAQKLLEQRTKCLQTPSDVIKPFPHVSQRSSRQSQVESVNRVQSATQTERELVHTGSSRNSKQKNKNTEEAFEMAERNSFIPSAN